MKVIVAGFPKTGTKTLNAILTKLGYNVYDYFENAVYLADDWENILNTGWSTEDFKRMFQDIDAVADVPSCYFWEEIHKAFPDSKIILTYRENEDEWVESFQNQLKKSETNFIVNLITHLSPTLRRMIKNIGLPISTIIFGVSDLRDIAHGNVNKELLKLKYRAHNAHVIQNAPADKLLVYKVTDGWDPLCKFLEVPVPDEPFPHKNKGGEIVDEMLKNHPIALRMKREMLISSAILTITAGVGVFLAYKRGLKNIF